MPKFKVGEVLIVREDSDALAEYKGREVEVLGVDGLLSHLPYRVRFQDGRIRFAGENHLRRRKPPAEYKGENAIMDLFKKAPAHA